MARALNGLADNHTLLMQLGIAGRLQVQEHFTVQIVSPKYLREFKSAIKGRDTL
jgi:hypothetical protein